LRGGEVFLHQSSAGNHHQLPALTTKPDGCILSQRWLTLIKTCSSPEELFLCCKGDTLLAYCHKDVLQAKVAMSRNIRSMMNVCAIAVALRRRM